MVYQPNPDIAFVVNYLEGIAKRSPDSELMKKGKEAYELIKNVLLKSGEQNRRDI
jgi:hypothetical protein